MVSWKKWNPGLDNDDLTLREVFDTLPGVQQEDVSAIVRLLENPESPFALKGAVALEHHDCIHIVLGRGLLNQDEAFVIGYTMGTSKDISKLETFLFKTVAAKFYPKHYRFNKRHLEVYQLAVDYGKHHSAVEKIYEFPFEEYWDWKLGDLREKLGIDADELRDVYLQEQKLFPHSRASKRLPV